MDCGVEVGRDPVATDPAAVADVCVVARRGTGDGALSGVAGAGRVIAGRHGDRRGDTAVERGVTATVCADAAANRAEGAGAEDSGGCAGGAAGL